MTKHSDDIEPVATKSLPLVKIKRVRGGMYRVYKLVQGNYKIKRTFFTMHQANRYVKGFKAQGRQSKGGK